MFTAYVRVVSDGLTALDLDDRLGSGDARAGLGRDSGVGRWRKNLFEGVPNWPDDAGISDFSELDSLADRIRGLVNAQLAEAWLIVVQEIDDPEDSAQKGISLPPALIGWLARAGAGLDIDQYIYV